MMLNSKIPVRMMLSRKPFQVQIRICFWKCCIQKLCNSKYFSHPLYKKVFFLNGTNTSNSNSDKIDLCLEYPYQTVNSIHDFGVKNLTGGFQRRPELIYQRQPQKVFHVPAYGLFDKCERIQQEMTSKALELMGLYKDIFPKGHLLDIGCGYGYSLSEPCRQGFCVTAVDLDAEALYVIQNKISRKYCPYPNVHIVRMDIAHGLTCFRENTFDFAISISFLQWLCVGRNSAQMLDIFFKSLSFILKPQGRAGIQFYPANVNNVKKIIDSAQLYFKGALVSDCPHIDRGNKLFLILINNK